MKTRMTRKQFVKSALLGGASLAVGMPSMLEALMVFYPGAFDYTEAQLRATSAAAPSPDISSRPGPTVSPSRMR